MTASRYFLGFDFSTQQIKAIAIDEDLKVVLDVHVRFHTDLPEFGTTNGVCIHEDQLTVTSPTAMWVKALDLLLDKITATGFDFSRVAALAGDGQQHGSVYWKTGAREMLHNVKPEESLYTQLKDCFSIPDSPIWMDASTSKLCRELETSVGGPEKLAKLTGCRAFERYTGSQIMKQFRTNPEAYHNTERISLVSSFAASLFLGDYAPIDFSDGSGMNLLDIREKRWATDCLQACGTNLMEKLGDPVASDSVLGTISPYLAAKYGFPVDCKVVAFTGDNPASLVGLAPREGDVIVSLGSSDTVLLWTAEATPGLCGHIFVNLLDPDTFLGLVCFKNGSLTRERIMEQCAGSWDKFGTMVQSTPPGNSGNIGVYFDVAEIQPVVSGIFRFDSNNKQVESFPPEVEVRALLESQFLARLMYAKMCGLKIGPNTRVTATGGASANPAILQVLADVFNTNVYVIDVPNSAALGSSYMAKCAWHGGAGKFAEVVNNLPSPVCAARPTPGCEKIYQDMMTRYRDLETQIEKQCQSEAQ